MTLSTNYGSIVLPYSYHVVLHLPCPVDFLFVSFCVWRHPLTSGWQVCPCRSSQDLRSWHSQNEQAYKKTANCTKIQFSGWAWVIQTSRERYCNRERFCPKHPWTGIGIGIRKALFMCRGEKRCFWIIEDLITSIVPPIGVLNHRENVFSTFSLGRLGVPTYYLAKYNNQLKSVHWVQDRVHISPVAMIEVISRRSSSLKCNLPGWKSTCQAWIWIIVKLQNW